MAQGIRNFFAGLIGDDLVNNPHLLTRNFAKGISWMLLVTGTDPTVPGNGAAPVQGVTVSAQLQIANPDGSFTTVYQWPSMGPSDAGGKVYFTDQPAGNYDLTKIYWIAVQAVFPDGSTQKTSVAVWQPGVIPANWGKGFVLNWITAYVVGTAPATQGVSIAVAPTSAQGKLTFSGTATPNIYAKGQTYVWWYFDNSATNPMYKILESQQTIRNSIAVSTTIYCVLTDVDGKTYQSPSVVLTVT